MVTTYVPKCRQLTMIVKQVPNLITLARLVLAVMAFYYMSAVIELGESGAEQLLVKAAAFSAFWYLDWAGCSPLR